MAHGTRRDRADGVRARPARERGPLPRPVRERERPDRDRRPGRAVDRRQRGVRPRPRLQPGGDDRDPDRHERLRRARTSALESVAARDRKMADAEATTVYENELARQGRTPDPGRGREPADRWRTASRSAPRRSAATSPSASSSRSSCARRRRWRRSAGSPAAIAHDFNNLLTRDQRLRRGCCSKAATATAEPELEADRGRRGARGRSLTRQLLAFSRRQVLQPRVLDLNDVVEGLTPMLTRLIGEDVELVATLDAVAWTAVHADPGQLEQVLMNLAVNARDAMPDGGTLTIETANVELDDELRRAHHGDATAGPHVMLAVSDTGVGMDARRSRAHLRAVLHHQGAGQGDRPRPRDGLRDRQAERRQHLGVQRARAGHDVQGLPAARRVAGRDERPHGAEAGGGRRHRDDPARRGRGIAPAAHRADPRTAGLQGDRGRDCDRSGAHRRTERPQIDLLLTDLVMPELSGSALAARVRKLLPDVRVLFMSGYSDEVVTETAR